MTRLLTRQLIGTALLALFAVILIMFAVAHRVNAEPQHPVVLTHAVPQANGITKYCTPDEQACSIPPLTIVRTLPGEVLP